MKVVCLDGMLAVVTVSLLAAMWGVRKVVGKALKMVVQTADMTAKTSVVLKVDKRAA